MGSQAVVIVSDTEQTGCKQTCERGIKGGPDAMSTALVPGLTLRSDPWSSFCPFPRNCSASLPNDSPTEGDLGPIWTSVNGGGLGKRGELDGDTPAAAMVGEYDLASM